jgi:DHA2 family multidrug resistance protein-like MFS transporter
MALVMALLPCAALGEILGCRRVFSAGLVVFIASSGLCAIATTLSWLVAARFTQGIGGAAIMALGIALLRQALPRSRMPAAIGWNALTVALCSAAGPTLGALILSFTSWHNLFFAHLPLGGFALLASRALPRVHGAGLPIDWLSMALSALGFGSVIIGVGSFSTGVSTIALLLPATAVCFVLLVRREWPKVAPLIPLDLLRERTFRLSVTASIFCFAGQTAGLLALTFYLQQGRGESTTMAGLYMTPWPLAVAGAAMISSRLSRCVPLATMCFTGSALLAFGLAATAALPLDARAISLVSTTVICGLGFGLFQVPNNRNLFLSASPARSPAAGGMQGTARLIGQTVGALMVSLALAKMPQISGPRLGMAIGAVCALAAALISAVHVKVIGAAEDVSRLATTPAG